MPGTNGRHAITLATIKDFPAKAWSKRIPGRCLVDRDNTIVELCRKRRVLHLGAADSPMHVDKAAQNELLHQKVRAVASMILGVDRDAEAVEFLRETHQIDDILIADATQIGTLSKDEYDVVLCCDIIEHVINTQALLDSCKMWMTEDTTLVITTINATALKPALRAVFGREAVHHDHMAYFSYATLCQLLITNGLSPMEFGTFSYPTKTLLARVAFGSLARVSPGSADGILITARLPEKATT